MSGPLDQFSFEQGMLIGLNTALVALRDGEGASGVTAVRDELKECIELRRNGGHAPLVMMTEHDLYVAVPLMHSGDLGFDASASQDFAVLSSRLEPGNIGEARP